MQSLSSLRGAALILGFTLANIASAFAQSSIVAPARIYQPGQVQTAILPQQAVISNTGPYSRLDDWAAKQSLMTTGS